MVFSNFFEKSPLTKYNCSAIISKLAKNELLRPTVRAISSVGQSNRLITGWSGVRVPDGPPKIDRSHLRFVDFYCFGNHRLCRWRHPVKKALASSIERSESRITIQKIRMHSIKTPDARLRAAGHLMQVKNHSVHL